MELRNVMNDICKELDEIEQKGLTGANWEMTAKLLEMKKNILKIMMLEEEGYSAGDPNGMNYRGGSYSHNRGGYSGRPHRDRMGRYASAADKMEDGITEMMERSDLSSADKDVLRRALEVIRR